MTSMLLQNCTIWEHFHATKPEEPVRTPSPYHIFQHFVYSFDNLKRFKRVARQEAPVAYRISFSMPTHSFFSSSYLHFKRSQKIASLNLSLMLQHTYMKRRIVHLLQRLVATVCSKKGCCFCPLLQNRKMFLHTSYSFSGA